jgi:hypothetical protein
VPGVSACVELEALEPPPRFAEYTLRARIAAWVILGLCDSGAHFDGRLHSRCPCRNVPLLQRRPGRCDVRGWQRYRPAHQDGRVDRYGTRMLALNAILGKKEGRCSSGGIRLRMGFRVVPGISLKLLFIGAGCWDSNQKIHADIFAKSWTGASSYILTY